MVPVAPSPSPSKSTVKFNPSLPSPSSSSSMSMSTLPPSWIFLLHTSCRNCTTSTTAFATIPLLPPSVLSFPLPFSRASALLLLTFPFPFPPPFPPRLPKLVAPLSQGNSSIPFSTTSTSTLYLSMTTPPPNDILFPNSFARSSTCGAARGTGVACASRERMSNEAARAEGRARSFWTVVAAGSRISCAGALGVSSGGFEA